MGDFPTHVCTWTVDGLQGTGIIPIHILDCPHPKCREKADSARRACSYQIEHIENMLADTRQHIEGLMKRHAFWELVLDAKRRELDA